MNKLRSLGNSIRKMPPFKSRKRLERDYVRRLIQEKPTKINQILPWVEANAENLRKVGKLGEFSEQVDFLIDVNDYLKETNPEKKRQLQENICNKYLSTINVESTIHDKLFKDCESHQDLNSENLQNAIKEVYGLVSRNLPNFVVVNAPRISHRRRRSTSRGRQGHKAARTRRSPRKQSPRKCHGRI